MTDGLNKRFVELLIATTIGSIVGAFIARDINFSEDWLNIIARAVIAVVILAVFFFALHKASISWGKRKKRGSTPRQELPPEPDQEPHQKENYTEEPYPEENYSEEQPDKSVLEEEDFPEKGGTREMKL